MMFSTRVDISDCLYDTKSELEKAREGALIVDGAAGCGIDCATTLGGSVGAVEEETSDKRRITEESAQPKSTRQPPLKRKPARLYCRSLPTNVVRM